MGKNKKRIGKHGTPTAPSTQQIILSNIDTSLSLASVKEGGDILEGNINIIIETEPTKEVGIIETYIPPETGSKEEINNLITDRLVYEKMKWIAKCFKHDWPKWHRRTA